MATGDHDWTAGEQVTAANMDDYLQLQIVGQYATAAARDTALSARKREGMVTYQIDTNTLTVYSGAAWSTIGPVHGALSAWTPAVVQSGGVASTPNFAAYQRIGRMVTAFFTVSCTGAGSASNVVTVSLPVTADAGYVGNFGTLGSGFINDSSAAVDYAGFMLLASTTTMKMRTAAASATPGSFLGAVTFTAALASGDIISGTISYPAAADA